VTLCAERFQERLVAVELSRRHLSFIHLLPAQGMWWNSRCESIFQQWVFPQQVGMTTTSEKNLNASTKNRGYRWIMMDIESRGYIDTCSMIFVSLYHTAAPLLVFFSAKLCQALAAFHIVPRHLWDFNSSKRCRVFGSLKIEHTLVGGLEHFLCFPIVGMMIQSN